MLELALKYLLEGYSIIPVGKNKIPLISWKPYQDRKATPEEVVGWWEKNPAAQIGIVTGEISDLTVVDIEFDGDMTLIKDKTFTTNTGGGGKHFYFKFEKEFKNAVRVFPSVDLRSTGGYIVGCPSVMQKGAYTRFNDLPVATMSSETKSMLLGATKKELPWNTPAIETYERKPASTEGIEYMGAGSGSRNDSMTIFAGSIVARLHPSLWGTIGLQLFEEANMKNSPPLPRREIDLIWKSISDREESQNPGGRDYSPREYSTNQWGPDPKEEKKEEKKVDDEDVLEEENDPKETLHASEVAELQKIDSDHTYAVGMPPFDDALLGGFSAGEVIVVAGKSGNGKTTIMQDWSVILSKGGPEEDNEKLPSLWFSYEVLAKPLWKKFQSMGANEKDPIYMPRLTESGESEWVEDVIEKAIEKWGIKVVCIDHLGFLRAPKGSYSNAADAITHTVRSLKKLAVKRGLIIFLPVHVKKTLSKFPDLDDIKDSSGVAQESDTVFFIARKTEKGIQTNDADIWLSKNRKTGMSVKITVVFEFGRYFYDADKDKKANEPKKEEPDLQEIFNEWNKPN